MPCALPPNAGCTHAERCSARRLARPWLALASLWLACTAAAPGSQPAGREPDRDGNRSLASGARGRPPRPGRIEAPLAMRVAERRGLAFLWLPGVERLSASEIGQWALERELARDGAERLALHAELLARLELVPADFDLPAALAARAGVALEGAYDPDGKRVIVRRDVTGARLRRLLVHELAHALQDQRFELSARLRRRAADSLDATDALLSLAEGAAERLADELEPASGRTDALPERRGSRDDHASLPDVLRRAAHARYRDGRRRVDEALAAGGWPALNALWAVPPRGTAALRHPERPDSGPIPASRVPPPGTGWLSSSRDRLGEQALAVVLEEWVTDRDAQGVAEGWRHDDLVGFRRDGDVALAWHLRFATATDAARAGRLLRAALLPLQQSSGAAPEGCREHRDGGVLGLTTRQRELRFGSLRGRSSGDCAALRRWLSSEWGAARAERAAVTRVAGTSPVESDPE